MVEGLKEDFLFLESCHLTPHTFAIFLRLLCSGIEERCQKKEDKEGNENRKSKIGWYQVESLDALFWLLEIGGWRRSLDTERT